MKRLALALSASALFSLAVRPWGSGYFALLALAVLSFALEGERSPLRAGLNAVLAWLGLALPSFEGFSLVLWWSFPAVTALHAVPWGLAGAAYAVLNRRRRTPSIALPLLLTAAEFLVSRRFLWSDAAGGLLAYTQADTVLLALSPVSGTSGVVLALTAAGAACHQLMRRKVRLALWTTVSVISVLLVPLPGTGSATDAVDIRAAVVQTARDPIDLVLAPYDDVLMAAVMSDFQRLTSEANESGAELVVWGETVLPTSPDADQWPNSVLNALQAAPMVMAGGLERGREVTYNSAFAWRGDQLQVVGRKQVLVPVVEGAYTAGLPKQPAALQGALTSAFVCLDSVHGELARASVRRGAELLVYLTDDSFAGRTSTPHLHLATAALRAAEVGRSVIFANESGPSALIGPSGAPIARSRHGAPTVLVANLPLRTGLTPYAALGDWLGMLVLLATAVLLAATSMDRFKQHEHSEFFNDEKSGSGKNPVIAGRLPSSTATRRNRQ